MRIKMGADFSPLPFFFAFLSGPTASGMPVGGVELEGSLYNAALEHETEERHREIVSYVLGLTKAQLQQQLINALKELDSRDRIDRW